MRPKSNTPDTPSERLVRDICRATRAIGISRDVAIDARAGSKRTAHATFAEEGGSPLHQSLPNGGN